MPDKVDNILMYILGERDFPLAPVAKLRGEIVAPLGQLVADAQQRLPDASYEDVIKLALRVGLNQLPTLFLAGGRVERGGMLSFEPLREGRKAAAQSALRAKLASMNLLAGILLGEREPFTPPQSQAPKDTLPQPPDQTQTEPPAVPPAA